MKIFRPNFKNIQENINGFSKIQRNDIPGNLGQHRTIWQEHSAKDFASYESYKRAGILYVFPPFITARMGQKIGRRPQTQLCGDALEQKATINRIKTAYSGFYGTPDQTLTGGLPLRSTAYHFVNCSYHIFPCCFFANCAAWRQVNLHKFP